MLTSSTTVAGLRNHWFGARLVCGHEKSLALNPGLGYVSFLPSIIRIPRLTKKTANFVGVVWPVSSYKSMVITSVFGRAS
jgi:hypothetical protein